jgi:hypothetical protein
MRPSELESVVDPPYPSLSSQAIQQALGIDRLDPHDRIHFERPSGPALGHGGNANDGRRGRSDPTGDCSRTGFAGATNARGRRTWP